MPPLVVLGLAWLGGIAFVALWNAPVWLLAASFAALIPVSLAGWLRARWWLLALAAGLALAGSWQHSHWLDRGPPELADYRGREVTLEGRVAGLPDPGLTVSRQVLAVDGLKEGVESLAVDGKVLLTLGEYDEFAIGTRLRVTGELEEPPVFPDFDYRGYLERKGIAGIMFRPRIEVLEGANWSIPRAIGETRMALEDSLQRSLPEPEASLAAGIALGRDGGLPDDLYDRYRRAGLAHLIAVSGSNIAILTLIVFLAAVPIVGRNLAILPAVVVLVAYVMLAGAESAVFRAGIMAAVVLAGEALGRQRSGLVALAVAAFALTVFQPARAADIGFQLSLAATAGLLVFGGWIEFLVVRALGRGSAAIPRAVVRVFALTLAATIATAPLIWLNFGQLSVVGLLANVLAEPLFALALLLSLMTAVAGVAWSPLGWAVGIAAWYPLALLNWLATTLGGPRWASLEVGGATGTGAAVAYVLLGVAGAVAYLKPAPETPSRAEPVWMGTTRRYGYAAAGGACLVAVLYWTVLPLRGPGELRVDFLDVGQGDAILITTPHGQRVIVDGGPSGLRLAQELGATMPHWARGVDRAVLTHPQQDHMAGFVELERRFDVDDLVSSGATNSTATYVLLVDEAGEVEVVEGEDAFELDDVRFRVLWPAPGYETDELNDTSVLVMVEYAGRRILLTGDIEGPGQRALLASGADVAADVLKVPHHGAATSDEAFFDSVNAGIAVISVGDGNQFGHPREETLVELAESTILRTDEDGRVTITVSSNGELRYSTER